jgi:hypothetical protein
VKVVRVRCFPVVQACNQAPSGRSFGNIMTTRNGAGGALCRQCSGTAEATIKSTLRRTTRSRGRAIARFPFRPSVVDDQIPAVDPTPQPSHERVDPFATTRATGAQVTDVKLPRYLLCLHGLRRG